ncbi:MAG: MFS transporter [Verrucomicrobiota bacterium]
MSNFLKIWEPDFPNRPSKFPVFYGWLIAFLATAGICASIPGQTIGVGLFKTRLMDALALTSMQLSLAYMIGTLLSALFLNAGGSFFDRVGARKAVVFSIVALGFVLLGMSMVDRIARLGGYIPLLNAIVWLPAFLTLTIGFAFLRYTGQGMVALTSRAMLGKWFDRRRGAVTAFTGAIIALVFSAAPICLEYLIRKFSWQGAWLVLGLCFLIVLVPIFWAFARDNPEESGLQMDGGAVEKTKASNPDAVIYRDYSRAEASRTFSFWAFTLMFGLSGLVITAFTFHILAIGEELAVSTDYILKLFIPGALVSVVTGFLIAWLTDLSFVRIKYLLAFMGLASTVGFGCVGFGNYPSISWLHIIGFGVAGGSWGSLSSIIYPRFFGREHLGAITGLFMTSVVVASALGPFSFSFVHMVAGSYRPAFMLSAFAAAALGVAAFWADNPQRTMSR